jgi:hypothetical protein
MKIMFDRTKTDIFSVNTLAWLMFRVICQICASVCFLTQNKRSGAFCSGIISFTPRGLFPQASFF